MANSPLFHYKRPKCSSSVAIPPDTFWSKVKVIDVKMPKSIGSNSAMVRFTLRTPKLLLCNCKARITDVVRRPCNVSRHVISGGEYTCLKLLCLALHIFRRTLLRSPYPSVPKSYLVYTNKNT